MHASGFDTASLGVVAKLPPLSPSSIEAVGSRRYDEATISRYLGRKFMFSIEGVRKKRGYLADGSRSTYDKRISWSGVAW